MRSLKRKFENPVLLYGRIARRINEHNFPKIHQAIVDTQRFFADEQSELSHANREDRESMALIIIDLLCQSGMLESRDAQEKSVIDRVIFLLMKQLIVNNQHIEALFRLISTLHEFNILNWPHLQSILQLPNSNRKEYYDLETIEEELIGFNIDVYFEDIEYLFSYKGYFEGLIQTTSLLNKLLEISVLTKENFGRHLKFIIEDSSPLCFIFRCIEEAFENAIDYPTELWSALLNGKFFDSSTIALLCSTLNELKRLHEISKGNINRIFSELKHVVEKSSGDRATVTSYLNDLLTLIKSLHFFNLSETTKQKWESHSELLLTAGISISTFSQLSPQAQENLTRHININNIVILKSFFNSGIDMVFFYERAASENIFTLLGEIVTALKKLDSLHDINLNTITSLLKIKIEYTAMLPEDFHDFFISIRNKILSLDFFAMNDRVSAEIYARETTEQLLSRAGIPFAYLLILTDERRNNLLANINLNNAELLNCFFNKHIFIECFFQRDTMEIIADLVRFLRRTHRDITAPLQSIAEAFAIESVRHATPEFPAAFFKERLDTLLASQGTLQFSRFQFAGLMEAQRRERHKSDPEKTYEGEPVPPPLPH